MTTEQENQLRDKYYKLVSKIKDYDESNEFRKQVADSIFNATIRALNPDKKGMTVVPADTGSGKTTYASIMAAALCELGYSCTIVSKTINHCHAIYGDICKIIGQERYMSKDFENYFNSNIPDKKVVIFTSHHNTESFNIDNKVAKKTALNDYSSSIDKIFAPILITTHDELIKELESNESDLGVLRRDTEKRDVVFLDETPPIVDANMIDNGEIADIRKYINNVPDLDGDFNALKNLSNWIDSQKIKAGKGHYFMASAKEEDWLATLRKYQPRKKLELGESKYKSSLLKKILFDKGRENLFTKLGELLVGIDDESIFYTKNYGAITYYKNAYNADNNFLLLDATSTLENIGGLLNLESDAIIETPKVTYENLDINFFFGPDDIKGYKSSNTSQRFLNYYQKYIESVIEKFVNEGEEAVVIAKKTVIDTLHRKYRSDAYSIAEVNSRKINFLYYGNFIGENEWKDIKKVIMLSSYQRPQEIYMGLDAAYKGQIDQNMLDEQAGSKMKGDVEGLSINESLKWFKQLAARGHMRVIDSDAKAGEMKLITDFEFFELYKYLDQLFPAAKVDIDYEFTPNSKMSQADLFTKLLMTSDKGYVTYSEIADYTGYSSSKMNNTLNDNVLAPILKTLGWETKKRSEVPELNLASNIRKVLVKV